MSKWAFWAVCGGMAAVMVVEMWPFKRLTWLQQEHVREKREPP